MNDQTPNRDISRRNVVKGAAWATPVVLAATAAPAYASSPGCLQVTGQIVNSFKWGAWDWIEVKFTFKVAQGCTIKLNRIEQSDLKFTNGSKQFTVNWDTIGAGGLPEAARTLTSDWSFTAKLDVHRSITSPNWPNLITLSYVADGDAGVATVPYISH